MFCPEDLRRETEIFKRQTAAEEDVGTASAVAEARKSNASPGSNDEKEEDEMIDEFKGYDVIWGRPAGSKRPGVALKPMPVLPAGVH